MAITWLEMSNSSGIGAAILRKPEWHRPQRSRLSSDVNLAGLTMSEFLRPPAIAVK
jgi:hypothetical protein